MDIVKKLEELKTGFRGYDKEAVHTFIQEILRECEQDKDSSMAELVRQNQTLQTEVKESKERLQDIKDQNMGLYRKLRRSLFGRVSNLPGRGGRKMFVAAYKICQKFYGFN